MTVARNASPPPTPAPAGATAPAPAGATAAEPVRVVVVDASGYERRFLRGAISAGPGLSVVGEAQTGRDALALVARLRPSAVVLDLDLAGMNAIDIIERIMATVPTPILVCSRDGNAARAAEAMAAGAIDVVARPADVEADRAVYAEVVRSGVRVAARVKVINHPRGRLRPARPAWTSGPAAAMTVPEQETRTDGGVPGENVPLTVGSRIEQPAPLPVTEGTVDLVAIGASTGGPQALAHLLGALPSDFAPAIVVVQHMADGFIDGLVSWLAGLCPLPVAVGSAGQRLRQGTVTVAPSDRNMLVQRHFRIDFDEPAVTQHNVPGIDATFASVAANVGARAVGIVLTGMGRDGATGLKAMRDAGAVTIGQDEESSAVWGMPAAAAAGGAVQHQLPLREIAGALVAIVRGADFPGQG